MTRPAVLAAVAAAALVAAAPARADHRGKIAWQGPDDGFAAALSTRKPMVVFFTAEW